MNFEHTSVYNFDGALRGMRNPMDSWEKSDSKWDETHTFLIGPLDMALAKTLIRSGAEHRKFLRQIFVTIDITAPMYFWSEFDTYKVGTVANSTSKMHKLSTTKITLGCFEMDDYCYATNSVDKSAIDDIWTRTINNLEALRLKYLDTKDFTYWKELIRLLPESWLQTRTVTMNYENIRSMVNQRKNHKLNEWSGRRDASMQHFIKWAMDLPYAAEFITNDPEKEGLK